MRCVAHVGAGDGRSKGDKSLARMWWDEIFTTCIGRMMIHSHKNMHPGQFRSFSAREYARAQGFPDWYKIEGSAVSIITPSSNLLLYVATMCRV